MRGALAINVMAESLLQPSFVQQYIQSSCFDDSQLDLKLAKFQCCRPRKWHGARAHSFLIFLPSEAI